LVVWGTQTYDRFMTLASWLTVLRAVLLGPTLACAAMGRPWLAFLFLGAAGTTDVLDGMAARLRNEITPLGMWLDPIVDKLFYAGYFAGMAVLGRLSWHAYGAFLAPQAAMAIGALVFWQARGDFGARWPGKAAGFLTAVAAFLVLLTRWGDQAMWGAVAAHIAAGAYYLRVRILNQS